MARTYEEQTEERAEERREGFRSTVTSLPDSFDMERLSNIVRAVPDSLVPGESDRRNQVREDARNSFRNALSDLLGGQSGSTLNDVDEMLSDLNEVDLQSLSDIQVQRVMAQSMIAQTNAIRGLLEAQITSATIQDSIATAVEPPSAITISGTNEIAKSDTPQSVVPNTEDRSIPVRELMIRADEDNSAPIYFGDDDISPEDGFMLRPGESESFELDFRDSSLYMAGANEGDEIQLLGVF